MKVKFDFVNAERNFAAAVDAMGKLTGLDRRQIVRSEAGSVLKRCFGETPKAPSATKMTTAGRLKALRALKLTHGGPVTITAGTQTKGSYGNVFLRKRDGTGYRRTHDANFRPLNYHYTDEQWAEIRRAISDAKITVQRVVPEVKATAGLARQSWVLIADSAGIRLESVPGGNVSAAAISSVRGAWARGNRQARNGASRAEETANSYVLTLINRLPYGNRLNFQGLMTAAIAGRAAFMATAIRKGFQASAQDVAKLFPGWTVKGNTS